MDLVDVQKHQFMRAWAINDRYCQAKTNFLPAHFSAQICTIKKGHDSRHVLSFLAYTLPQVLAENQR